MFSLVGQNLSVITFFWNKDLIEIQQLTSLLSSLKNSSKFFFLKPTFVYKQIIIYFSFPKLFFTFTTLNFFHVVLKMKTIYNIKKKQNLFKLSIKSCYNCKYSYKCLFVYRRLNERLSVRWSVWLFFRMLSCDMGWRYWPKQFYLSFIAAYIFESNIIIVCYHRTQAVDKNDPANKHYWK